MEQMVEFRGKAEARLNHLEDKAKEHSERLTNVEKTHIELAKTNVLLESYMKESKEMFRDYSESLKGINENLNNLNKNYENLKLGQDILDKRMETVEDTQKQMTENNTVNIAEQFKRLLVYGLPSLVGGLVLASLIYFLGIK